MFKAEAAWLAGLLAQRNTAELSPLLNVGSSTRQFREVEQPWTEGLLFAPLRARGVEILNLDSRAGDGIDVKADILSEADRPRLEALKVRSILCCNILEHVTDPGRLARRCIDLAGPGGFIFVTVPYSYPFHRDPIDTLYRPGPAELAQLFAGAEMLEGAVVDSGESFRDQVRARPWILSRQILRFPVPFLSLTKWQRSMAKLYWLFHNYQITGAVFRVPGGAAPGAGFVDSGGRGS
jgi:hypothetical protein